MQTSKIMYLKEGTYKIDQQNPQMCLGKGAFGKVFKGRDTFKNIWVAVKVINIELLQEHGQQMKEVILNEINVMRKFTKKMNTVPCDYLVKQFDCFRSDKCIYIVMEYCQNGTLLDEWKIRKVYPEAEVIEIARQLLEGLMYLEQMGIAHRDLKPENIFISQSENGSKVYKIGDFGFAARKSSFNDILGTYQYMAPQIFRREEYTTKVDIWSLGITLHQLLFGEVFYSGKNKWEIEDKIKAVDYSLNEKQCAAISKEMQHFLRLCLTKNKTQRPSASALINHSIFSRNNQSNDPTENRTVFSLITSLVSKCTNLLDMSQSFSHYQASTQHHTIFIQLYLLKFAFVQMNRAAYSVMNKSNYINLPNEMFEELISVQNSQKYEELNQLSQEVWNRATERFNEKFEEFQRDYVPRFSPHDQELIRSAINNQPYEEPVMDIFVNQLKKWTFQLSKPNQINQSQQFFKLRQQCQKIVFLFEQNC